MLHWAMRVHKIHITPSTLTSSTYSHRTCLMMLPSSPCASSPRSSPVLFFTCRFSDKRRHLRTETHTKLYSHCHISIAFNYCHIRSSLCSIYFFLHFYFLTFFLWWMHDIAFTVLLNDVDVQFFVRLRTLCLCVLLANNQEIIRTAFHWRALDERPFLTCTSTCTCHMYACTAVKCAASGCQVNSVS